jgi:hypothetical protein
MQAPSPLPLVFVACAFADAPAAQAGVRALLGSGVAPTELAIGAAGAEKPIAAQLAQELGIGDDVDPADPLAGAPGLASATVGANSVDFGGVVGSLVGALAGAILSLFPTINIVPLDPHYRIIGDMLLLLVVGALAGATLGGALAPQRSTHAAFRIVDEIEHHGFAVVARLDAARAAAAAQNLEGIGGLHVIRVPEDA